MPRITTVIFDMYETLVQNPEGTGKASFAKTIAQQGLNTTAEDPVGMRPPRSATSASWWRSMPNE